MKAKTTTLPDAVKAWRKLPEKWRQFVIDEVVLLGTDVPERYWRAAATVLKAAAPRKKGRR